MNVQLKKKLSILLTVLLILMGIQFSGFAAEPISLTIDHSNVMATSGQFDWSYNAITSYEFVSASATLNGGTQPIVFGTGELALTSLTPETLYTLEITVNYNLNTEDDFTVERFWGPPVSNEVPDMSIDLKAKWEDVLDVKTRVLAYYLSTNNKLPFPTIDALLASLHTDFISATYSAVTPTNNGWSSMDVTKIIVTTQSYLYRLVGTTEVFDSYEDARDSIDSIDSDNFEEDLDFDEDFRDFTVFSTIPQLPIIESDSFTTLERDPLSTYTINFISNGGTSVDPIVLTYDDDEFRMPADPTRLGFTFDKWLYFNGETRVEFTDEYAVMYPEQYGGSYSVNVGATWIPDPDQLSTFTINFISNGGTEVDPIVLTYDDDEFRMPADPTRLGFTFDKWLYFNGETRMEFTDEYVVEYPQQYGGSYSVNVGATWIPVPLSTFTINFISNGGTSVDPIVLTYAVDEFIMPADPTRTGYVFDKWLYFNGETRMEFTDEYVVMYPEQYGGSYSVNVGATWILEEEAPSTYKIIFNSNGGTVIPSIDLTYDEDEFTMPANPTRSGYYFNYWAIDTALTTVYSGGTTVTYVDTTGEHYTLNLYAKWTPETITNTDTNTVYVTDTVYVNVPTPTEEITTEPTPLGPAEIVDFDQFADQTPMEPTEPAEEIILDDETTPLGDALPQTGQLPAEMFYGFGGLISAIGVFLKRRK